MLAVPRASLSTAQLSRARKSDTYLYISSENIIYSAWVKGSGGGRIFILAGTHPGLITSPLQEADTFHSHCETI